LNNKPGYQQFQVPYLNYVIVVTTKIELLDYNLIQKEPIGEFLK